MNTTPDGPSAPDCATLIGSFAQASWETSAEGLTRVDSPSWRAYTGQSQERYLSEGWLAAIHPDDRDDARQQWQQALAGPHLLNGDWRLQRSSGGWCWTNILAAPVLATDGSVDRWVGLNIDISRKQQTEQALAHLERVQAARMSHRQASPPDDRQLALQHRSETMRAVSHDLKGSFGIISGALSLLELADSDAERAQYVEMALRNVRQATGLLSELLGLTGSNFPPTDPDPHHNDP